MSDIRRTRQPLSEVLASIPNADAVMLPGVPSARVPDVEEAVYPTSAPDVRKILLDGGVTVVWGDDRSRSYLTLKAAEHWLPVVVLAEEALANGLGGVLTAAFLEYIGGARAAARARLHIKVGRIRREDGTEIEWFEADGDAASSLDALQRFLDER